MRAFGARTRLRSMPERKGIRGLFRRRVPKVGAALGSGGAKGLAHLGALQALAENGIAFDVYAGTSAGAIVGALSARGYTPRDIVELFTGQSYGGAALGAMLKGSLEPLVPVVDDALGGCAIEELGKPFCAIATDAESGAQVVLRTGNAARAVLASSSMPPLFRGMRSGVRSLADGAFCNAVPGDAARALGADFVIGIALSPVSRYRETEYITSSGEKKVYKQTGFACCDILLEPDLSAFRATDVQYGAQMYDIGYTCAQERMGEILRALRRAPAARNER